MILVATKTARIQPKWRSLVAQRIGWEFQWRHQISYDGTHTEQIFTFKVKLFSNSQAIETIENLLTLSI